MRIHILGSSGFIGSQLYRYFSEDEYQVKGYSSIDCDLLSSCFTNQSLHINSEDVIIMASGITRLKENSLESMVKNIQMADNIAQFINNNPIAQFIFLSTIDVYGIKPQIPINETLLPNPQDYYALSKLSSEFIIKSVCSDRNIPLLILRLSGIYGGGDKGKSTINKLVESAKNGKIIINGNGEDKRDFVYVKDVYGIIQEGIHKKINITLDIATGRSYSINHIIKIVQENSPKECEIEYAPQGRTSQKRNKNMVFDISLLKENFPDFEFTKIEEGMKSYLRTCKSFE